MIFLKHILMIPQGKDLEELWKKDQLYLMTSRRQKMKQYVLSFVLNMQKRYKNNYFSWIVGNEYSNWNVTAYKFNIFTYML